MSVHIKCDRCGTQDDPFWRNLKIDMQRGMYGGTSAPQFSDPWRIERHICGYCAAKLREWWTEGKP